MLHLDWLRAKGDVPAHVYLLQQQGHVYARVQVLVFLV